MQIIIAFSVIALAALIHTSFQLGISLVTLLSNHATGKKLSGKRVLRLVGSFLGGAMVMTALLIASFSYVASILYKDGVPASVWEFITGALAVVGIGVWIFYYRRGDGTSLWLPRSLARHLSTRVQATTYSAESFSLGLTGVLAEIIFLFIPVSAASLAIISLPVAWQPIGLITYVVIASFSLFTICALIGSGRKLSQIQEWRESNKRFLQFVAGFGLFVLSGYIYVNQVIATVSILGAG